MLSLRDIRNILFPRIPNTAAEEAEREEKSSKRIAALQSRGNVSVQLGRIHSEEDVKRLRTKVVEYNLR